MARLISSTRVTIAGDVKDFLRFEFSDGSSFIGAWHHVVPLTDDCGMLAMYVIATRPDSFDVDTRRLFERINLLALGYNPDLSVTLMV